MIDSDERTCNERKDVKTVEALETLRGGTFTQAQAEAILSVVEDGSAIKEMRTDVAVLKAEMAEVRRDVAVLKWGVATVLVLMIAGFSIVVTLLLKLAERAG